MSGWIIGFIEEFGYAGIVALMVLENVFPPIPSELILPFAGFAAAQGSLNPFGVVAAGVLGSVLGALPWYAAGRALGIARVKAIAARHGRWLTVSPDDISKAQDWFARHGAVSVMLGRLVPAVRSLISLPAGVARMPLPAFLAWSALGTFIWSSLLCALGFVLESRYEAVQGWVEWVTRGVVAVLVVGYVWRVVRFRSDTPERRS